MKEVYLAQGKHPVQIGYNRRLSLSHRATMSPNPHGPAMKETDVVFINDEESEMAVLYSYPAHPVSVHSTSTEFSADFPGYTARYIQSRFPGIVPIFLQGCAGNINSTLKGGYEAAELDGNKLGDAVINSSLSAKAVPPSRIVYGQHNFHLPYRELEIKTTELIAKRIEESFRTMRDSNPDFQLSTLQKDLVNWSQKLRQHAANNEKGLLSQAQAIALGKSLAIIAFPDELFVEYALYIKEHSPFEQTIVLAYTNGSSSYIPTAEALFLGGYEPGYAQVVYGQPFLTPECDRIIKEESIELLNELWENYETH